MAQQRTFTDRATAIALRTYHRPLDLAAGGDASKLESWPQVVDRVISHQRWLWERQIGRALDANQVAELDELRALILDRKALCSGRTLWLGGTELSKRRESSMFNCSYTHLETVYDLVDILWLLLQGCGVGFRPIPGTLNGFRRPLDSIKIIRSTRTTADGNPHNTETFDAATGVWTIQVGDSAVAWAKSIGKLVAGKYDARTLVLDFSQIRPAGTRLSGYGWVGSGDTAISVAYEAIAKILSNKADQLLSRMDLLDIVNWLGTILSSRRSAQIALFEYGEPEWREFATAKHNWWLYGRGHRQQSNNSLLIKEKPTRAELEKLFKIMVDAGGSEPGFVNKQEATKRAPWFAGVNPCVSKDTWIATNQGYKQVLDLIDRNDFKVVVEGKEYNVESNGFFKTGVKQLYEVTTKRGYRFELTDNHKINTPKGWRELRELVYGDEVLLANNRAYTEWEGHGTFEEGWARSCDGKTDFEIAETESSSFYKGVILNLFKYYGTNAHDVFMFSRIKPEMMRILHRMLLRLGIVATLSDGGLYINDSDSITILKNMSNPYKYKEVVAADARLSDTIENIRATKVDDVYDVTVSEVHEFSGNGIRLHNCVEYLATNKGFCNLSEVNLAAFKDRQSLDRALYLIGRMNYRQTLVNLKDEVLQEAWNLNNMFYRFCGVGITGVVCRPELTEYDYKRMKNMAITGAYSMALELGTPIPKNTTVIKPSGTLSKIMGTQEDGEVSEGVHRPIGRYVINSVGFSKHDPLTQRFIDAGYDVIPKPGDTETMLIKFPVMYKNIPFTKKTVTRIDGTVEEVEINDESAIDQLKRYIMLQQSWCEQNTSCTVYYDKEETKDIIDFLIAHWDHGFVGVAFLFRCDPTKTAKDMGYLYLPQEVVCKSTYDEYVARLKPVNYSGIIAVNDLLEMSECAGGACPMR